MYQEYHESAHHFLSANWISTINLVMSKSDRKSAISTIECGNKHLHQPGDSLASDPKRNKSSATPTSSIILTTICLICIIGLALIVHLCDDRVVSVWIPYVPAVQPAVLIALLKATFQFFQNMVTANGIVVVWWRALHRGTGFKTLHYISGEDQWLENIRALAYSLDTLRVSLVVLITSAVGIWDGPLLQRSIDSVISSQNEVIHRNWKLPASIEAGWVGKVDSTAPAGLWASADLDDLLRNWDSNTTISAWDECDGELQRPYHGGGSGRPMYLFPTDYQPY